MTRALPGAVVASVFSSGQVPKLRPIIIDGRSTQPRLRASDTSFRKAIGWGKKTTWWPFVILEACFAGLIWRKDVDDPCASNQRRDGIEAHVRLPDSAGVSGSRERRLHFRLPRRRDAAAVRRSLRPSHPPHPGAARAKCRVRGRRLCAIHGTRRRLLRHLRPRRHQSGNRAGGFHDGLHSRGRHHRPGFHQADRQRRVSGSRHVRHHALLHQAQFPGEDHRGIAAGGP